MAKTKMLCPFNQRLCDECPIYRGRHFYLGLCQHYRGYLGEPETGNNHHNDHYIADIEAFDRLVKPWFIKNSQRDEAPDIRLKVIDMETGESRICGLEEAKTWDWSDPSTIRMIDGLHITSWNELLEILRYKSARGYREVVFYEGPRFMLLGGG
jgi:hypothetical protein